MTIAVVRQMGGIGDWLMLSPVFRGLRETYPDAILRLLTSSGYMRGALTAMAAHNLIIDEVVDVPPQAFTTARTRELQPTCKDAKLLDRHPCVEGVDRIIDLNTVCWDTECAEIKAHGRVVTHRTDIWCREAGVDPSSKRPIYAPTPDERIYATQYARKLGWMTGEEPIVLVCLASHAKTRSLSPRRTLEVMDGLRAAGMRPVAVGLSYALPLEYEQLPLGPLAQTFPLFEIADAFVGVDSGLLHVAGTMGTPLVGLFGSTDPAMRLTYYDRAVAVTTDLPCRPCWYAMRCAEVGVSHLACLSGISTESVVGAVQGILGP